MDSNLEILISAVDEASGTIAEVGDSVAAMAEEVSSSMDALSISTQKFADQFFENWNAASAAVEGYANTVQISIDQVMADMDAYGISAQQAADEIVAANARISTSATTSAEASEMSAGAFAGLTAVAGIAFFGIKSAIGDAISSAEQWNETSTETAQILKDTGSAIPLSQVQAYAQQVQSVTLFSQQDVLSSEALLLSHKNLQGSYENLTMVAADLATKMGSNLPNATRMLTNALADPVAGLNQLIRQGNIDFPAATVTMIENMAKVGNTAGADALILQTLQNSIGGVATAATGAPGAALAQLSNQITTLGTAIGKDLLPLLDTLATDLEPVIKDVTAWTEAHPKLTDTIVLGTAALAALALIVGLLGVAWITVTPVMALAGVAIAALAGPIGLIALLVGSLAVIVTTNWKLIETNTMTLVNLWEQEWQQMSTIVTTIWQVIQTTVKGGVDYVISAINAFINALDALHISIPSIAIPGTKLSTPAVNLGFNIPDLPMLADGGLVTGPTLALIGEAGPEAVVPLSSASAGFGQPIIVNIQGGYYLDQNAATQIGNALAKQIVGQLRVRNYAS